MTQDERESAAEWKRLDYNAEIQRQHDAADMEESEEYYAGFDAALNGWYNLADTYGGQEKTDYALGYADGQHERAWQLQHPNAGTIELQN